MADTVTIDNLRRYELINGIRADLWAFREREIQKFIAAHKLRPVSRKTLGLTKEATAENLISIEHIVGIRGGRKVPHLHFKGQIYLLKSKQWREFSGALLKDLSKQLSKSNQVSFNELLDISESVGSITR